MPRRRRQGHADAAGLIGPLIDRRDRARIVIAARLHDPDRERLILARARRDHRSVRRLAVPVFERGKRAELILGITLVEPLPGAVLADLPRFPVPAPAGTLRPPPP